MIFNNKIYVNDNCIIEIDINTKQLNTLNTISSYDMNIGSNNIYYTSSVDLDYEIKEEMYAIYERNTGNIYSMNS